MTKTNEATRFKPKPPGEKMVRRQVYLRPDQVARLALEPEQSKFIRDALDERWNQPRLTKSSPQREKDIMNKAKWVNVKVNGVPQWGEIYQMEDGSLRVYDPETFEFQGVIEEKNVEVKEVVA